MISLLFLFIQTVWCTSLPTWVTNAELSNGSSSFVICSHLALDPEKAKLIAEDKCLESALKTGGVEFKLDSKTVQTTVESDQSDIYVVNPLHSEVKCLWTNQFIEKVDHSFRVWLRCRVLFVRGTTNSDEIISSDKKDSTKFAKGGVIRLSIAPPPDQVIVENGLLGSRFVKISGSDILVELKIGDKLLHIKKLGFVSVKIDVSDSNTETFLSKSVALEKEL